MQTLHFMIWGPWTMVLFLATGLWFTIRSRGFQIWGIRRWWKATAGSLMGQFGKEKGGKERVTAFQSACTALAATIGTGNIVGVATALTAGGPGALVWMWISALIGMMTAYGETVLGQQYRYRREDGQWMCGPMVYIERGLGLRRLGLVYGFLAMMASLSMGSMVQSNSIGETLEFSAGLPPTVSAVFLTVLTGIVIFGGTRRISRVAERLMPVSAGIYIFFSCIVILSYWDRIPAVLGVVFADAFTPEAAGGGISGFLLSRSVRFGLSRGVFSNEAGLGSLAVLHGAAEDSSPQQQGMWAMFEVFFDTVIICTLTALVILCVCGGTAPAGKDGAALTAWCFSWRLGILGEWLVSGAMVVFAFATIIAWYYLGRQTAAYLGERIFRRKEERLEKFLRCYRAVYLAAVFSGCLCRLEVVWLISDIWNGLMAYPNLAALWVLGREVSFPGYSS